MEDRLQEILMIALENDVTDIHFSIMDGSGEAAVEMRVHDRMRRLKRNPADLKLFHYLMYRANLDISNALQPQTGATSVRPIPRTKRSVASPFTVRASGRTVIISPPPPAVVNGIRP